MAIRNMLHPICESLGLSIGGTPDGQRKQFEQILGVAQSIAKQNPQALPAFVRLLGRKLQGEYMSKAVSWISREEMPALEPKRVWFAESAILTDTNKRLYDLARKVPSTRVLSLSTDLVMPWPWSLTSVATCLSHIGTKPNPWRQDLSNHRVEYWLPFGIGWVHGGNHSIMTGILQGGQQLETKEVYDLSALFLFVHCDGIAFRRTADNSVIAPVREIEFAAIYEVGRLMLHHNVQG